MVAIFTLFSDNSLSDIAAADSRRIHCLTPKTSQSGSGRRLGSRQIRHGRSTALPDDLPNTLGTLER